jgi:hypothetical protein
MSTLVERAQAIAAKAQAMPPHAERALTATFERGLPRTWYVVTKAGKPPQDVAFNPAQTIAEARALYPGCSVEVPK